jgi:hypothetical protein
LLLQQLLSTMPPHSLLILTFAHYGRKKEPNSAIGNVHYAAGRLEIRPPGFRRAFDLWPKIAAAYWCSSVAIGFAAKAFISNKWESLSYWPDCVAKRFLQPTIGNARESDVGPSRHDLGTRQRNSVHGLHYHHRPAPSHCDIGACPVRTPPRGEARGWQPVRAAHRLVAARDAGAQEGLPICHH